MRKKRIPKFYYIYVITNKLTGRQYVGSRVCYEENPYDDNYMGSSEYLSKDILEYGIENFKKKILKDDYKNYGDLLDGETFYILEYKTLEPNGYNRFIPNERKGFNTSGISIYEIWKMKYGEDEADKRYKKWKEKERLAQVGEKNPFYNKKHSDKTKEQIRIKQTGKRYSDEVNKKKGSIQSGANNGMFGKIWITNKKLEDNKIIINTQLQKYINNGWTKGRKNYRLQRT